MKIFSFIGVLGLGGTERAACRWAVGLKHREHDVAAFSFLDGPRHTELTAHGVKVIVAPCSPDAIAAELKSFQPDLIHAHAPGHPHPGDVLGEALKVLPKIPVVQTNVFGHLRNPSEDAWTDFRLFISWTSCVQAARRTFKKLDESFFHRASVAVYPLDPVESPPASALLAFRERNGIKANEVLFGRLSRPDPNKWTNLVLDAFQIALRRNPAIRLLLREPPPQIAAALRDSPNANRFVILPATADTEELRLTMAALDVVLHTSSIGESFGYGIAEPMNLGKPVITHSVPWADQAQIELVRQDECGLIASTPAAMAEAILKLAGDASLRQRMGTAAREHIRAVADTKTSIDRIEQVFHAVLAGRDSPFTGADMERAIQTAAYLDEHQFGHSLREQLALRSRYYRARFHEFRHARARHET